VGIHPGSSRRAAWGRLKALAVAPPSPSNSTLRRRPLPDSVHVAAYYVVSEALTNVCKHAMASVVRVHGGDGGRVLLSRSPTTESEAPSCQRYGTHWLRDRISPRGRIEIPVPGETDHPPRRPTSHREIVGGAGVELFPNARARRRVGAGGGRGAGRHGSYGAHRRGSRKAVGAGLGSTNDLRRNAKGVRNLTCESEFLLGVGFDQYVRRVRRQVARRRMAPGEKRCPVQNRRCGTGIDEPPRRH